MAANSCEMDAEATPNTDVVMMNGIEEATPNTNQSSQLCVDNLLVSRPRPVGSNLLARGGGEITEENQLAIGLASFSNEWDFEERPYIGTEPIIEHMGPPSTEAMGVEVDFDLANFELVIDSCTKGSCTKGRHNDNGSSQIQLGTKWVKYPPSPDLKYPTT
ncbi:hypothetical protein EMCRGX_G032433 [Ephydatia muelleri]